MYDFCKFFGRDVPAVHEIGTFMRRQFLFHFKILVDQAHHRFLATAQPPPATAEGKGKHRYDGQGCNEKYV
jgi:hypothetical protein